jgi:mannose-6-phosphate isomerase-like protein (cupin superfamily)
MAGVEVKSVNQPDEVRQFPDDKGEGNMLDVAGHSVMFATMQPGWRWSEQMKPVAGTEQCEATHLLYCISGRMKIQHQDGTEAEIGPGDVAAIEPGHDAWVEGDEACVSVDFGGYRQYGQPAA